MSISAAELRDLGDWREMLSAHAAMLAAQRASDSTAARLELCAHDLATAASSMGARRALGRFNVELAAAAQSIRFSRAEVTMHEEFDWLVSFLLSDSRHRQALAQMLRVIAACVRNEKAADARDAASSLVRYLVTQLVQIRLMHIADSYRNTNGDRIDPSSALPQALKQFESQIVQR